MIDARLCSVMGTIVLLTVLLGARRVVLTWSTMGVFFVSHTLFVAIGVLGLPWFWNALTAWFVGFDLALVSPDAAKRAIILNVGGLVIALLGYEITHFIATRGRLAVAAPNLVGSPPLENFGFSTSRVLLLTALVVGAGWLFIAVERSTIATGIAEGWLQGDPKAVLDARRGATDSYAFVVIAYNVAPFLAVTLWMWSQQHRTRLSRLAAAIVSVSTVVFLLTVFQKRPLIVFLLCLAGAHYVANRNRHRDFAQHFLQRPTVRAIVAVSAIGGVLLVLFYLTTGVRHGGEGGWATFTLLVQIGVQRVFGRLALPAAMYAEYFPAVEPHYGLSNIAMIAKLLGRAPYADTPAVFAHFANSSERGSVAVSAINDFYGAFGIAGWIVGCVMLGAVLNRMDAFLAKREPCVANVVLVIFMFVFAYYLSQASFARSLLGYGALFFLASWWILYRRQVPASRVSAAPTQLG